MKTSIITLLSALLINGLCFGQDILTYKNGTEVKVRVTEVTSSEVKFKKYDNLDGPLYTILKSDLFMIKYENGAKDVFSEQTKTETIAPDKVEDTKDLGYDRIRYSGPRVGMTIIGSGSIQDRLKERGISSSVITQFGWQLETRLFTTESGLSGLVEWVFLVGGMEKGIFVPSVTMLLGLRLKKGFEFGLGPNLSLAGFGMALAVGSSFKVGKMIFPVNLGVIPSVNNTLWSDTGEMEATGVRVSLLVGFNTRSR